MNIRLDLKNKFCEKAKACCFLGWVYKDPDPTALFRQRSKNPSLLSALPPPPAPMGENRVQLIEGAVHLSCAKLLIQGDAVGLPICIMHR